jgi:hypothetical protein
MQAWMIGPSSGMKNSGRLMSHPTSAITTIMTPRMSVETKRARLIMNDSLIEEKPGRFPTIAAGIEYSVKT